MEAHLIKIARIQHFSENDLIESLRQVTLLKRPEVTIYEHAYISLETINPAILSPAQNYILRSELKKVRELKWALEAHNVDIYLLRGYLRLWMEGLDDPIDLLPPVVEESIERNGSIHFIINDGMHRVYMALREWTRTQAVVIRGIPREYPYYAFPVPGGWESVEEREDLPEGYLKKWHRIADYHALYRNFNSAFLNVGAPRVFFEKNRQEK